jgi:hypothetical protein
MYAAIEPVRTEPKRENTKTINVFLKPLSIFPWLNTTLKLSKFKNDLGNCNAFVEEYSVLVLKAAKNTLKIGIINTSKKKINTAYLTVS